MMSKWNLYQQSFSKILVHLFQYFTNNTFIIYIYIFENFINFKLHFKLLTVWWSMQNISLFESSLYKNRTVISCKRRFTNARSRFSCHLSTWLAKKSLWWTKFWRFCSKGIKLLSFQIHFKKYCIQLLWNHQKLSICVNKDRILFCFIAETSTVLRSR